MTSLILIAAASIVLGIFINYIITKVPKLKIVFQIFLPIAIIVLAFFLYKGIETPIKFNTQMKKRYEVVKQNLIDIRSAQVMYKSVNKKYANDFDVLLKFINNDSIAVVKAIGSIPDSLLNLGMMEAEAIQKGIIIREKNMIAVIDTLPITSSIDSLKYIPFSNGQEFEMGAGEVLTGSNVKVKVFEARAHFNFWLIGLDRQLIINIIDEKKINDHFPGLKVGSLEEANNNSGNWE